MDIAEILMMFAGLTTAVTAGTALFVRLSGREPESEYKKSWPTLLDLSGLVRMAYVLKFWSKKEDGTMTLVLVVGVVVALVSALLL